MFYVLLLVAIDVVVVLVGLVLPLSLWGGSTPPFISMWVRLQGR
jgi:hypothetical protein